MGDDNKLKVQDKKGKKRLLLSSRSLGTAYSAWEENRTLGLLTFRGLCVGNEGSCAVCVLGITDLTLCLFICLS